MLALPTRYRHDAPLVDQHESCSRYRNIFCRMCNLARSLEKDNKPRRLTHCTWAVSTWDAVIPMTLTKMKMTPTKLCRLVPPKLSAPFVHVTVSTMRSSACVAGQTSEGAQTTREESHCCWRGRSDSDYFIPSFFSADPTSLLWFDVIFLL